MARLARIGKNRKRWRAKYESCELSVPPLQATVIIDFEVSKNTFKKSVFQELYVENGLSKRQISKQLLCSKSTVDKQLKIFSIESREKSQHHGRPAQPSYGSQYRKGKLTHHLGEKRVVRTILEMHEQELSLRQIAKFLDMIGVPTKNRGKKWHPQMIKRILDRELKNTFSDEGEVVLGGNAMLA